MSWLFSRSTCWSIEIKIAIWVFQKSIHPFICYCTFLVVSYKNLIPWALQWIHLSRSKKLMCFLIFVSRKWVSSCSSAVELELLRQPVRRLKIKLLLLFYRIWTSWCKEVDREICTPILVFSCWGSLVHFSHKVILKKTVIISKSLGKKYSITEVILSELSVMQLKSN